MIIFFQESPKKSSGLYNTESKPNQDFKFVM